jgi:RimJ/RimL family protein N-acetyltransferase
VIRLRELARSDIPVINRWRADRSLTDGLGAPYRFIGLEVDEAWFEAYLRRRGTDVRCIICANDDALSPLGIVSLLGIDPVHRHAEFHLLLGERSVHGRGIGTAATIAMVRHGFVDLNLHRIFLSVLDSNRAAIRVYEKAGFQTEGRMREAAHKNGEYRDMLMMAMLRSDLKS